MATDNKATVRRIFDEAWNRGDTKVLDECVSQNWINVDPGQSRPFETTIDVEAGQSLFFVVDPGRASNCDTTELELSIVLVARRSSC